MKTHVIKLESHDDFISVRDKMGWSHSARILLVWPEDGKLLNQRLDLLLLQRHGQKLGARIAIVSQDGEVVAQANELHIPVFPNAQQAQHRSWRTVRKSRGAPGKEKKQFVRLDRQRVLSFEAMATQSVRIASFTVGILAVISIILFLAPRARISVNPQRLTQVLELTLKASPQFSSASVTGNLPAKIQEIEVEGLMESASSGSIQLPDQKATGTVLLSNLTDQMVEIPIGTRVSTVSNPIREFEVLQQVILPPLLNGEAEVSIRALEPGSDGNVDAGEIQAVEGSVGIKIRVTNQEPLSGGTDRSVRSPTVRDFNQIKQNLLQQLKAQALSDMQEEIGERGLVVADSINLAGIVEEMRTPGIGQPGDTCTVKIRAKFQVYVIQNSDIQKIAVMALDAGKSDGMQAGAPVQITTTNSALGYSDGYAILSIHAERELVPEIDRFALTRMILGRKPSDAALILQTDLQLIAPPIITLSPSWWPWLPFIDFRIDMEIL